MIKDSKTGALKDIFSLLDNAVDLTRVVSESMEIYPGDPVPRLELAATIAKEGVNVTSITLSSHAGTHVDAPLHLFSDGEGTDDVDFRLFCGEGIVIDLSHKQMGSAIEPEDFFPVENQLRPKDIVLFYTGSSVRRGDTPFTYIAPSSANRLISRKIKCVGIDSLSVEQVGSKTFETHKLLLSKGVGIIEGLDSSLGQLVNKRVLLLTLPLKIRKGDGSPARAIAIPISS